MIINLIGTSPDGDAFDFGKTTGSPIVTSPGNILERFFGMLFTGILYILQMLQYQLAPPPKKNPTKTNKNDKAIALSRGPINLYFVTKWV